MSEWAGLWLAAAIIIVGTQWVELKKCEAGYKCSYTLVGAEK